MHRSLPARAVRFSLRERAIMERPFSALLFFVERLSYLGFALRHVVMRRARFPTPPPRHRLGSYLSVRPEAGLSLSQISSSDLAAPASRFPAPLPSSPSGVTTRERFRVAHVPNNTVGIEAHLSVRSPPLELDKHVAMHPASPAHPGLSALASTVCRVRSPLARLAAALGPACCHSCLLG